MNDKKLFSARWAVVAVLSIVAVASFFFRGAAPLPVPDFETNLSLSYFTKDGEQIGRGAWPPRTGERTDAMLVWQAKDAPVPMALTARLQDGFRFSGTPITANARSSVSFDDARGTVTWRVAAEGLEASGEAGNTVQIVIPVIFEPQRALPESVPVLEILPPGVPDSETTALPSERFLTVTIPE